MVTPMPEIPSDVLSLLDGYFKQLLESRAWLEEAIEKHRDVIGELRAHNWLEALDRIGDLASLEMSCSECQEFPYRLGLWPLGRGNYACNPHADALKEKGDL